MPDNYKLIDNDQRHRYEFHIDGFIAKIDYIKNKEGEIYLTHTEVPPGMEGKGIGSELAEKVFKDIEKNHLRLIPICPFIATYLQKHPEWKRLVFKEGDR